ncbi:FAS1-like dehydratase domain-containing protein [Gordonia insulae]|nr:MaoC family dehydratase N-terminal domain-containing protein [Gordonia insulae]
MTFTTSDEVVVDTALLAGFADVLGSRSDTFAVPVIFRVTVILAHEAMDSGTVPSDGIVHTAESLRVRRQPRVGDRLTGLLTVEEIHHRGGATQLLVRSDIMADGEVAPIAVTTSTLAFRTEGTG